VVALGFGMSNRVAVLAALGLLAACGRDNPTANYAVAPPPVTLPPSTRADLSATVTSPEEGRTLNCREDVHARVTVTNRGGTSVLVNGIRRTATTVSGRCVAVPDFTYGRPRDFALPDSTTVVFDQELFTLGSGCCQTANRCSGSECGFRDEFVVITELGDVPAGTSAMGSSLRTAGSVVRARRREPRPAGRPCS
jgi:hypothetical protein